MLDPAEKTIVHIPSVNARESTKAELEWADLVMTGGMMPQRSDTLTVIALAQTGEPNPRPISCL